MAHRPIVAVAAVVAVVALALVAAGVFAPGRAAGPEKEEYSGEILGVDRQAKSVTVRTPTSGGKETHVFRVNERTVITDRKSGKSLGIDDLHAGDSIYVRSEHTGGERVALELEVKKSRESREAEKP